MCIKLKNRWNLVILSQDFGRNTVNDILKSFQNLKLQQYWVAMFFEFLDNDSQVNFFRVIGL